MLLQKLLVFVPWFIKAKERDVEAGRQLQEYANSFVRDVVAQSLNEENVDSVSERVATLLHEFPSVQFHERHHDSLLFVTSYIHCLIEKIRKTEKEAELQDFVAQFVLNVCLPQLQNWPNEQQVQPASKEEDQAVTMLQKHVCFILATHATEHVEVANMLFKECESSLETSAHEDSSKYHVPALLSLIACILLTVQHKEIIQFEKVMFDKALYAFERWQNHTHRRAAMNILFPVYLSPQVSIEELWNRIIRWAGEDSALRIEAYALLVLLFDKFFDLISENEFLFDLRGDEAFWKMIISGLIEPMSFTTKRSTYLLHKTIDLSMKNPQIVPAQGWSPYFKWNKKQEKELDRQWQIFSLLYDSLDNHALHLIQPIWPEFFGLIPQLNQDSSIYLEFAWLKVILVKAFNHPNFSVQRLAILSILEIDFLQYKPLSDIRFVCETLIFQTREPRLFIRRGRIGERIVRFFHKYFSAIAEQDRSTAMAIMLNTLQHKAISKITLSYYMKMFGTLQLKPFITGEILESLEYIIDSHCVYHTAWVLLRLHSYILDGILTLCEINTVPQQVLWRIFGKINYHVIQDDKSLLRIDTWMKSHSHDCAKDAYQLLTSIFAEREMKLVLDLSRRFARLVRFVVRCLEHQPQVILSLLQPLNDNLTKIYKHPNMQQHIPLICLICVTSLVSEFRTEPLSRKEIVLSCISLNASDIISYIQTKIVFPESLSTIDKLFDELRGKLEKEQQQSINKNDEYVYEITDNADICSQAISSILSITSGPSLEHMIEQILDRSTQFLRTITGEKRKNKELANEKVSECNIFIKNALSAIHAVASARLNGNICANIDNKLEEALDTVIQTSIGRTRSMYGGILAENTFLTKWEVINMILHTLLNGKQDTSHLKIVSVQDVLQETIDALDLVKSLDSTVVIDCLRLLFPVCTISSDKFSTITEIVDHLLKSIGRQTEAEGLFCFCTAILNSPTFINDGEIMEHIIKKKFIKSVMDRSERAVRVMAPLAYLICSIIQQPNQPQKLSLVNEFISLLFFIGDSSDEQDLETCHMALRASTYHQQSKSYPALFKVNKYIRAMVVLTVKNLKPNEDPLDSQFMHLFVTELINRCFSPQLGKNFCMPSSPEHRRRLRVWKMLIFVHDVITEPTARAIDRQLWSIMNAQSNTNVRRLMEYFMILLAQKHHFLLDSLSKQILKYNEKQQFVTSVIIIAGNILVNCDKEKDLPMLLDKLFPFIKMYLMSHSGTIKIVAQTIFENIYDFLNEQAAHIIAKQGEQWNKELDQFYKYVKENDAVQKKIYKYKSELAFNLKECARSDVIWGCIEWEGDQAVDDYIPLHFFDNIYHNMDLFILSISSVCQLSTSDMTRARIAYAASVWKRYQFPQEQFSPLLTREALELEEKELLERIATEEITHWMQEGLDEETAVSQVKSTPLEGDDEDASDLIYQRKIIVWSETELEQELNPRAIRVAKKRQPVIVVASYIDKLPNLAGLSRTCEIFQAEKLVIANAEVVGNEEFNSISVSAHLWLPIEECPENKVMEYVKQKKLEGYTIIGVEQTSSSVSLEKFTFPERCVLVLGREKEGIPTELLQIIDVCVEIPQLGIIRSLNVHVSASIMLFDYTRQRLLKK